jgi:hypothetical protein
MTEATNTADRSTGKRQRAIDAYEGVRDSAADTLGQSPLIALAGGLAAGALIAALLPRTETETRAIGPAARRARVGARAALDAARDTGSQRLQDIGLTRGKAEDTIRNLLREVTEAAKASASAALDAARDADEKRSRG